MKTRALIVILLLGAATRLLAQAQGGPEFPPIPFPAPRDGGSEAFRSYQAIFQTAQFPTPVESVFAAFGTYDEDIRRLLFSRIPRSRFSFDLRFLVLPSMGGEMLYCVQERTEGHFVEVVAYPSKRTIWGGAESKEAPTAEECGIVVKEREIDAARAYELIGLWNQMLERVRYQRDELRERMPTDDGVSYYFSSRHQTLGLIEGESANPREDTIVARAAAIGEKLAYALREDRVVDNDVVELIRKLRNEII